MRPLTHRRVAALTVLGLCAAVASTAAADWQVKRDSGRALREQALRALLSRPEDPALAARALRGAGQAEAERTLQRAATAAGEPDAAYSRVLAHAQLLVAAGRPAEAATEFARAIALRPSAAAAQTGRAHALEKQGHVTEALAAYAAAATLEKVPGRRRVLLQTAAALAARVGATAAEVEARRGLVAERPADVTLNLTLARALGRAGQAAEGSALLERLLASSKGRIGQLALAREAASLREATGELEASETLLRSALGDRSASSRERLEIYRQLVRLALRRGRGLEIEPWLQEQARAPGSPAVAWQALAELRQELGDYEGAVRAWREVGQRDPAGNATPRLVQLLDRLGRDGEVLRLHDRSAARGQMDADSVLEMIERKYRRGERQDAQARFDRAFRQLRRSPAALVRLADLASRWNEGERVLACWDALLALDPRDERAIVGLGEAHFQAGRRELARRTWHALLRLVQPPAAAHARLAELLGDHDLLDEALPLARSAQKLEPAEPGHHRTLARILEKKRELAAAVSEWRAVLGKSLGPERAHERREARARIVNLLAREGRERLRAETVLLKDRFGRHPEDRESALFLAELQLRLQSPADAVQTLSAAAEAAPGDTEVVPMLVRLLRQSRQTDPAVAWLERFAAKVPGRAPEALLQVAEIRLERYEDQAALAAANRAVELSRRAPEVLMRAAELQDRAGQPEQALASYRGALGEATSAKAALAAAGLLVRRGEAAAALAVLRQAGRTNADPEARADLMARELDIAEYAGELADLVSRLAREPAATSTGERRLVVELYRRVLPDLYRRSSRDEGAHARWQKLAATASRPLIALLVDPEGEPDPALIDLTGMMGNRDVIPVLLRLTESREAGRGDKDDQLVPGELANSSAQGDRVVQAALIALGRLRAAPALARLLELSGHPEAKVRAAAVWALGRLEAPEAESRLRTASRDPRAEVAALAALGLGRLRTSSTGAVLRRLALDAGEPVQARRGALLGLAMAGVSDSGRDLLSLLDGAEPALTRTAAFALGVLRDRAALSSLWRVALVGRGPAQEAAALALAATAAEAAVPDDGVLVGSGPLDAGELLDALSAFPAVNDAPVEALWIEHAAEIGDLLQSALGGRGDDRRRALLALDSRAGGLGLGRLLSGSAAVSARASAALAEVARRVREPLGPLLTDPDVSVRVRALRVASKLADERVTTTHIIAALEDAAGRAQAGPEWDGLDPAEAAVGALEVQKRQGRLDAEALWRQAPRLLQHPAWAVRLGTVQALGLCGTPPPAVLKRALADTHPLVRTAAQKAFADGFPPPRSR
jgi:tetratricopeptide (TPR) repeat protein